VHGLAPERPEEALAAEYEHPCRSRRHGLDDRDRRDRERADVDAPSHPVARVRDEPRPVRDEPSSGLDLDESVRLATIISRVRNETKMAVLLIDHDVATVDAVSERVIAMDAGTVIAEGTFNEVVHNSLVMASWLGRTA